MDVVVSETAPSVVTKTTVPDQLETKPAVVTDPAPAVVVPSGITMAEVRTHNSASGCWSVVDGLVYDLTAYIPKHPGGKGEILAICGTDGSRAFNGQHGGESKPERILASYKIGELAE
jgi:cytochrome b involved in lipid metabolism